MKKVLLSAAALAMATTSFAGLTSVSAEDKVVLDFTAVETAYGADMWPEIIEAYKEVNPNVEFKLTQEKELEDAITPRLQSGDHPDIVMLALSRKKALPETLIKDHALEDLTDVLELQIPGEDVLVKDKLQKGYTDTSATNPYGDGKTYLMPMFYSPTGLFYNKGLFEEKGWETPTNWDDMWKLAEEAKKDEIALFTYPRAGYLDTVLASMLYSVGGPEFYAKAMNYDPETWESDKALSIFNTLVELAHHTESTTLANATPNDFTRNQQLILDNKALFIPNGTWVVDEMAEAPRAEGFEWGMTALPAMEKDGQQYAYTFIEHIWIPAEAKQKEAAKDFLAFLYSDKAAEIFMKHGAVQPINGIVDKLPEDKKVFYGIYEGGKVLPGMGSFATVDPIEGVDFNEVLYYSMDSAVAGELTGEQWRDNVVEMMKQFHEKLPQ